jgi:FkbM family methyltransferase
LTPWRPAATVALENLPMGLITYGVPSAYVLSLKQRLGIDCFVETGTSEGRTAAWAAGHFKQVITIELSDRSYHRASVRLARHANVRQLLGSSPEVLAELARSLPPAVFWLDAHWDIGNEVGRERQCPLLEEIAALAPCWEQAFVLVDDASLFLSPPPAQYDQAQWPSLGRVVNALSAGRERFVACFEDVFVSLPPRARDVTLDYIRAGGDRNRRVLGIVANHAEADAPAGFRALLRRSGGGVLRDAATGLRQMLRRPAMGLGRALGHIPADLPLLDRCVWFLRNRFEIPRQAFEVDFRGCRYAGSGNDVIDMAVHYFGAFEWPVVALLSDLARGLTSESGKPVFYDIGANSGQHSLFVAREVGRIYAFEPFAPVREKFKQRVLANRLGHIEILAVGLGDVDGEAHYYQPLTINRGTGSFLAGTNPENSRRPILLPVARGDRLIEERGLLPPDLIKLDVEGSEKLVLSGLAQTIRRHRPVIVSELSDASRWLFGDESGLRAALYDDCLLFEVAKRRLPRGYRLRPFTFDSSTQFLCLPQERAALLARLGFRDRA